MNTTNQISASEIRQQVEQICSSAELGTKNQLCLLFRYLVNEALEGRTEQLKGYTIGIEVFEKGEDFDPEQNPIVRIHAGRLRRMLRLYYLEEGRNDPIKIEIPKGKYIPFFTYQPSPSVKENLSVDSQQGTSDSSSGRLRQPSIDPSIAVMPFKNLTGDPDKEYYALGFSEELSVELTRFEDLLVINPILLIKAAEGELSEAEDIKSPGVHFIVDGSVQMLGDKLKILVKLIDTNEGTQIWADRFISEFDAQNLPEVLENIAYQVSGILGSEYGLILQRLSAEYNQAKPQISSTYNAILKYYHYEAVQNQETFASAFGALQQALISEPESGIATAMLASMYGTQYMLDLNDPSTAYKQMGLLAEQAMILDPGSSAVRTIAAYKHFAYNEKDLFFKELEKCMGICSNSAIRMASLAMYLALYGAWEEGMKILDRIKDMGLSFPKFIYGVTTLYYYRKKEYGTALEEANLYTTPTLFWGPMLRTAVLGQLNNLEECTPNISHLKQLKPDFENQAVYLIGRYVKEKNLLEHILEGLRMAGMKIKSGHLIG